MKRQGELTLRILASLRLHGPSGVGKVAADTGQDRQTVDVTMRRLARDGSLRRTRDGSGTSAWTYELTDEGRAYVDELTSALVAASNGKERATVEAAALGAGSADSAPQR